MKVIKCPSDELSLTNRAICNPADFSPDVKHIEVSTGNMQYVFTIKLDNNVPPGYIGFSMPQRKWASLSLNQDINVRPYFFDPKSDTELVSNIVLEADFLQKKSATSEAYDTDLMAKEFIAQFCGQAFTVGQPLVFSFKDKKLLCLVVKELLAADIAAVSEGQDVKPKKTHFGKLLGNTVVQFDKAESSSLNLTGKARGVKRKALCMDTKIAVIKALESGEKKSDVAKRFNLIYSTVNSIWSARYKIEAAVQKNPNHQTKKLRKSAYENLDEALMKWFTQQRSLNFPVSGPILKIVADQLAAFLGIENYDCSNGWIERFKKRHNINFGKVYSEERCVNRCQTDEWVNDEWTTIKEQYQDEDIFSGSETGLYFRMNPNSVIKFEGASDKVSKERLNIFLCANATGTEKRELLVIGKSQAPRCFKNVKKLPVKYVANRNSWMTAEIFEKEIRGWDEELAKKGRKIVLLLDNCTANPHIQGLKSIRLVFLPRNTNSVLQPMDQGVIRSLKCCYRQAPRQSIINPDWDFQKMGIGGLDTQFNAIFRRAFASRVYPPELIEKIGCKHVKGILLYGPPGTGKTLLARQIGKMLNAREPKIVNGPQILDKYVGESEANIRRLFADAEEEEKRLGPNSGLHIIIFDEIDAICKARGSVAGASGVHDTVVNQLLTKIDGVDQLNNILVIGMTNRKDMIDEALLRPGRLEVQMEIGLPDEKGRLQILNIHTARMKEHKKLGDDVDLRELASLTKNFSGAEIEGLVRAAQSTALNRFIKATSKVEVDPNAIENLSVTRSDFLHALENDIKPAFGMSADALDHLLSHGIINWGKPVQHIFDVGKILIEQAKSQDSMSGVVTVLLEGPPNSGKTALAAQLAKMSQFPFIKVCSPEEMVGFSESAKCLHIRKIFDDAHRSALSCVLVDNIERLLDYGAVGPRYSNITLQALLVLLKKEPPKGRRLMVLCTSSRRQVLEDLELLSTFTAVLHVPNINATDDLLAVLEETDVFSKKDIQSIAKRIHGQKIFIGIRKLLGLIDMARQINPQNRAVQFLTILEEEGGLGETGTSR